MQAADGAEGARGLLTNPHAPNTRQQLLEMLEHPESLSLANERRTKLSGLLSRYGSGGGASTAVPGTPIASYSVLQEVLWLSAPECALIHSFTQSIRSYIADALGMEKALSSLPDTLVIRFGFEWTSAMTRQTDKFFMCDSPRYEFAMLFAVLRASFIFPCF